VDWAEKERVRLQIEAEANRRFSGAVQAVIVLESPQLLAGPSPSEPWRVKTGKVIARVLIRKAGPDGRERTLRAFWQAHRGEMQAFRDDLSERFPQVRLIQFTMTEPRDPEDPRRITMTAGPIRRHSCEDGPEGGSGGR
jgi:hypothetical protein